MGGAASSTLPDSGFTVQVIAGICTLVWVMNIGHFSDPIHGSMVSITEAPPLAILNALLVQVTECWNHVLLN